MLSNLTQRLTAVVQNIKGSGRLSEKNIKDTLRQVRLALLEADVSLPVVKKFIGKIKDEAVGTQIHKSLTPGQALTKIIKQELTDLLGIDTYNLNLRRTAPIVIMLVGLQGSGKTTTAAKLAKIFIEKEKKKVMLVSVDIHRPAVHLPYQLHSLPFLVHHMIHLLHAPTQLTPSPARPRPTSFLLCLCVHH